MITIEKIETYKRFHGDIDGFSRAVAGSAFSDEEWLLIGELLSGLHIVRIGMGSPTFVHSIEQKLLMHVADEHSREELRKLSERGFD